MANPNETENKELLYLDDLYVGQRFTSGTHLIDEAQITAFARQFDPQPTTVSSRWRVREGDVVRRVGGERLTHGGDLHAACGGKRAD